MDVHKEVHIMKYLNPSAYGLLSILTEGACKK